MSYTMIEQLIHERMYDFRRRTGQAPSYLYLGKTAHQALAVVASKNSYVWSMTRPQQYSGLQVLTVNEDDNHVRVG